MFAIGCLILAATSSSSSFVGASVYGAAAPHSDWLRLVKPWNGCASILKYVILYAAPVRSKLHPSGARGVQRFISHASEIWLGEMFSDFNGRWAADSLYKVHRLLRLHQCSAGIQWANKCSDVLTPHRSLSSFDNGDKWCFTRLAVSSQQHRQARIAFSSPLDTPFLSAEYQKRWTDLMLCFPC